MVRKLGSIRSSRTMLSSSSPTSARRTHSSPLNSQVQSNDYASSGDIKKVFSKPRSFVSASAMVDQVRVPESARGAAVNIGRGSTTYMPWRSGNESAKETTPTSTLCARVIKSYRAFNNKELTVREGDIVRNVAEVGLKDWLKGSVGGMVGYFPASHVVMMIADSVKQGFGNSGSHSSTPNLSPSDQRRGSQTSVTSSSSNYNTRLPASSMPRNIVSPVFSLLIRDIS
ncbi:hypothetical protein SARC_00802 [Sphaeroforma arctica JP610]|uniref:SH3 domain-containing protein n=1 Tax=Sphaeroforma arctica JP610 TaxID=667725 RepID=A0A0L0GFK4_9EUKA|nr:hypothetical protein SARC_00802 [Sphaeroforma arctica JP610]KNC87058.1 hypothetical protein SARC_00802 [Sphaeroforma arctica JP610]|eukprot:XP_014160960.1 hypothetical protein SARC_00802 [Sphaeroforma arctica JP610]